MADPVQCPRCAVEFESAETEAHCPACGLRFSPDDSGESISIVRRYFRDLRGLLLHPVLFFRRMPVNGGLAGPLTFALVTHWIGSALEFLWSSFRAGRSGTLDALLKYSPQWSDVDHPGRRETLERFRVQAQEWMSGMSSVLIDPFLTLFSILVTAAFVFVGARILVPQQDGTVRPGVTYESAVRIVAFGLAPAILTAIPFAGSGLATLGAAVYTIIGAREVYKIGTGRAIVVGLFPKLLLLAAIFGGLLLVFYFITRLIFAWA